MRKIIFRYKDFLPQQKFEKIANAKRLLEDGERTRVRLSLALCLEVKLRLKENKEKRTKKENKEN